MKKTKNFIRKLNNRNYKWNPRYKKWPRIYRFEKGAPVFTILTKDASSSLSSIHDRMPVMVKSNEVRKWLTMSSDVSSIIKNSVEDLYFEPYKK